MTANFVEGDSPADRAGLKKRDVLIEFNGEPIRGQSDMFFKVAEITPGKAVTLKILRDKKEFEVKATVGERPPVDLRIRPR